MYDYLREKLIGAFTCACEPRAWYYTKRQSGMV